MITAVMRTIGRQAGELYTMTFRRIGELFWENPKHLALFGARLGVAALLRSEGGTRGIPVDRRSGRRKRVELEIIRAIIRSFFRGIIPVTMIGVAGGIAVGTLAGSIGPLIRPFVESPAMGILLANILPLVLALLLAARNGASVAARLALLRPPDAEIPLDRDRLLVESLPSLVAAPLVAGIFYAILASCLIAGYLVGSARPITVEVLRSEVVANLLTFLRDFLTALGVTPDYAQARGAGPVVRDGALKSLLYGFVVAYSGVAFGVRSAERRLSERAEYLDFNNAVWESGVTALTICGILTFLLWTNL